jgi:hypothetical protein
MAAFEESSQWYVAMSAFDPKRTSAYQIASAIHRALLIYLNALSD